MRLLPFGTLFLLIPTLTQALPRDPAVSRTHVAFVESGQVWVLPRQGKLATRLTDSAGSKFTPRFSPDGASLAFAANDAPGQVNLQVLPVRGGTPVQRTFLPFHQVLNQWTEGGRLLFHTNALSFSPIEMQLFTVPATGGLPERLPPAYGSDGALDPAGEWLAYTPQWPNPLIANWKRYRGGAAPDLWLLNLRTRESRKVTDWPGADLHPMWDGSTLYYLSDQGAEGRLNLWSYDRRAHKHRQVTRFRDHDVLNPSIGPGAIVFELGPDLYLLDLDTGKASPLVIELPESGRAPLRREVDASRFVTQRQDAGKGRVLLEARGDLWLAGTGSEAPVNLTATSGAFEREAAVSPDGRTVAYWSDATGEYQLYLRSLGDLGGSAPSPANPPLTRFTSGFRYRPVWSADSKRLAFADQAGEIAVYDVATGRLVRADAEPWAEPVEMAWSPDGTWLAYTRTGRNRLTSIWRYDTTTGRRQQLTSDAFNSGTPVFAPNGERLFFVSYRNFGNPVPDWLQQRIAHRATGVLMSVPLRGASFEAEAFERSASRLGASAGAITALGSTHDGNPVYGLTDLAGTASVRVYDLRAKQERVILSGSGDFALSADGLRLILERDGKPWVHFQGDSAEAVVRTEGMSASIDLAAEWRQIFDDAWRFYRDFFYAPKSPLRDWDRVRERYAPVLARCRTREEVNRVLANLIGESSVGHAYVGNPGDVAPAGTGSGAALLGADLTLEGGAFRITRILQAAPWDDTVRSPLREAREGEYLLAVDGVPLDPAQDPRQALAGRAGQEVKLTVGPHPARDTEAREIVAVPAANERELRRRAWVEDHRRRVTEASGGRIGYVHFVDFSTNGMNDFVRQYYGQVDKDALVIDARWSTGGWTGGHLAELLARPPLNYAAGRYTSEAWPAPRWGGHFGAKALLVNHITVSAGENFALYFRKLGLGRIVGSRTWGGLTGLNGVPALLDGGTVNVPNAPFYDESGWLIEGRGLEPDRPIEWDPARSDDPQLAAAVQEMLAAIAKPYRAPAKP